MNLSEKKIASKKSNFSNSHIVVQNLGYGLGVFATQNFAPGEPIVVLESKFRASSTQYSIQIDVKKHLDTEGSIAAFLNHSCHPNARFMPESLTFVALQPIKEGDEITFNYLSTEWDMAVPFECKCGSKLCKGKISGFKHLSEREKQDLSDIALPYLTSKS